MKLRDLVVIVFVLLMLPILLPLFAGTLAGGLLCGARLVGHQARRLFAAREPASRRRQRPADTAFV